MYSECRRAVAAIIAATSLVLGACAGEPTSGDARAAETQPLEQHVPSPVGSGEAQQDDAHGGSLPIDPPDGPHDEPTGGSGQAPGSPPSSPLEGPRPAGQPSPGATPQPMDFPHERTVPVTAELQPTCVRRGAAMTLTVTTNGDASVGYNARYFGDESGGEPPWGHGHGGNGGELTGPSGQATFTWHVSPQAPVGPAIADVVVAWEGEWGYEHPRFEVVDDLAACD